MDQGIAITRNDKLQPMAQQRVEATYFEALSEALKGPLPELDGGPFLRRFTVGNLVYPDAISAGRPTATTTMLAFELAFYLRMLTALRAEDGLQAGQTMPSDGKPCYELVQAFCGAVFTHAPDAKQTAKNVTALKNVGLTEWP